MKRKNTLISGRCRVCGCVDEDCRQCIERTGAPCSWANAEHTLCTACIGREPKNPQPGLRMARGGA